MGAMTEWIFWAMRPEYPICVNCLQTLIDLSGPQWSTAGRIRCQGYSDNGGKGLDELVFHPIHAPKDLITPLRLSSQEDIPHDSQKRSRHSLHNGLEEAATLI